MAEAERALIAAKEGDLQTLRSLRRSVPFVADVYGATTLHHASRTGQMACVKWLVEAIGISPTVRGKSGATPLHDAAAQGQLHCVKYFLGNGAADVETRDLSGHTALHLAARFGRFATVKWLIEKGNSNVRAKSRNHMTPVHFAAAGGHLTCLELLVFKAGYSSVNDVAIDGTTPLYLASQDGNLDCIKYLHSVGGKCNARARDGMLPIHGAAQNGHLDCVGYLIESGQAEPGERDSRSATPAHYAAAQGHVSVLKWLNAKGDISSIDELGGSPLHDAAEQGQFECIRYLVETSDLDVNQRDKEGLTPLALALKSGHRRCIDYLKIAVAKKAKAQRRQVKTNKQYNEDGTKSTTTNATTQAVIENFAAAKIKSPAEMASQMKNEFTDNNNNTKGKGGQVKIQSKWYFPSFSFSEGGPLVSKEELPETSIHDNSAFNYNSSIGNFYENSNVTSVGSNTGKDNYTTIGSSNVKRSNSRGRNDSKMKKEPRKDIADLSSSSDEASSVFQTAKIPLHGTHLGERSVLADTEPVKLLRERQLQPLPHICDVIPPPAEFSENSHFSEGKDDEKDGSELSNLGELSGQREVNQKQGRFQQTDSLSVIVEIQSLEADGLWQKPEVFQDSEATMIGPEIGNGQRIEKERKSHVTRTGSHRRRADQSEEFQDDLPPWKRQVLLNRKLREKATEKAEREKKEIHDRKWIGVASWKIPMLAKREQERMKEEQRRVGMPQWKKELLSRMGSVQIYRDYHAGNSVRPTKSAEPTIKSYQSPVSDYASRPRGMTSWN